MGSAIRAFQQLKSALKADYDQTCRYGDKYHSERSQPRNLPADIVQKIGLQMLAAVRLMQAMQAAKLPILPQVVSRLIRHVYGAEIHWRAKIEPGVAIVHGCGLVISHAASVGSGTILFQNVTLGESMDPDTRQIGAPTIGRDVHIGPGATIIGPVTVGDRTKIMAGAVLTHSVPPDSLVRPSDTIIATRRSAKKDSFEPADTNTA